MRSLAWRTPEESLYGEVADISVFRFPCFCAIWYYNGREKLPNVKMKPGYFLGVAEYIGDAFTYLILPAAYLKKKRGRHRHLVRSVIRLRTMREDEITPHVMEVNDEVIFTDCHGKKLPTSVDDYDIDVTNCNDNDVTVGADSNDENSTSAIDDDDSSITTCDSTSSVDSSNLLYSDLPLFEKTMDINDECTASDLVTNDDNPDTQAPMPI